MLVALLSGPQIRAILKRCTAIVQGTYLYETRVAQWKGNMIGGVNANAYAAVVSFEVDGRTWEVAVSYSERLGSFSCKEGDVVEVHYDPADPQVCWARVPNAKRSMARSLPVAAKIGWVLLVVGVVMAVVC